MQRPTVLVVFGGESSEHEVSIFSVRNVFAALDDNSYDIKLCYIDRSGKWWLLDSLESEIYIHDAPQLLPALGSAGFVTMPGGTIIKPDVILPILHGENGEDGSVQGLAQLLHIPIVGCDMTSSAASMNKLISKQIASVNDITVVPFEVYHVSDNRPDYDELSDVLGSVLFVKPVSRGSSMGVSKVQDQESLQAALDEAFKYDNAILIERAITARELEVAVLGDRPDIEVSVVGEIIPDGEFYSYESKYSSSSKSAVAIPAVVSDEVSMAIRGQARKIYEALGCGGMARVDFFLSDDGVIYFNEINTIPGFTNISMYPKLWRAGGMTYPQLLNKLIQMRLPHESEI